MANSFLKPLKRAACLLGVLGLSVAWAGPTQQYWHEDAGRALWPDAPQPAEYRAMSLDTSDVAAYLKAGRDSGAEVAIELPLPEGGFTEFKVIDSGTLPVELQAKYPDILSFKGSDAQGRRLRLDVSPIGFQAMVFDPEGIWVVRPEELAKGTSRYLVFRRAQLALPDGFDYQELMDEHRHEVETDADATKPVVPMTQTGVQQRHYRAAVAANHQYIASVGGGTVAGGLAATAAAVNRVSEVYEYEMSIRLTLVPNNDLLMFPSASGDLFGSNGTGVIDYSTEEIDDIIGSENYDIGHVFTTGSGGIAGLGVVCRSYDKGRGTTGLPNPIGDAFYIDFVAHEMGHQFGGNHPFNGSLGNCSGLNRNRTTAYEPGSGSSIMAYAGICSADNLQAHSDPYFHAISLQEITNYTNSASGNCSVNTTNPNQAPVIDVASLPPSGLTLPARTPFKLYGEATDADPDDVVMYSWEEWDLGPQAPLTAGDNGSSPIFRTWPPQSTGERVFPSMSTVLGGPALKGETLPTTTRPLKFRLTARDLRARAGGNPGSGTSQSSDISLSVVNTAGPFKVNSPAAGVVWEANGSGTVTWDVANTNVAPVNCANVDIYLSSNGGDSFDYAVASAVPNSGSALVTVPPVTTTAARVYVGCSDNLFFNVSPANFTIAAGGTVYTVGGTVSGLNGSNLMLRLNGGNDLPVTGNGNFSFSGGLVDGATYVVTVATQPTGPMQECVVTNGSGTINDADVSDVAINCTDLVTYSVGGTVNGLVGTGLALSLNGGPGLPVAGSTFTFPDEMLSGDSYSVVVSNPPTGQSCSVSNGSGVIGSSDVTDVVVDCVDLPPVMHTVGGRVTGLTARGLVLQLNGDQTLAVNLNGVYAFVPGVETNHAYSVAVLENPEGQECVVSRGSGVMGDENVTNVDVACGVYISDRIFADGFEGEDDGGDGDVCEPEQLFQDPGFEASVDYENPFWFSEDSLDETSLCDEFCDDNGTFVARTGDWFVWFGGWDEANVAFLSQSVVFPAGQPRWLNYWMVNQIEFDDTASLTLSIDGSVVKTFAAGGDPENWEQNSFQVPAEYLDGQSHTVRFDWSAEAPNGDIAGAMFDDVTLDCEQGSAARQASSSRSFAPLRKARR